MPLAWRAACVVPEWMRVHAAELCQAGGVYIKCPVFLERLVLFQWRPECKHFIWSMSRGNCHSFVEAAPNRSILRMPKYRCIWMLRRDKRMACNAACSCSNLLKACFPIEGVQATSLSRVGPQMFESQLLDKAIWVAHWFYAYVLVLLALRGLQSYTLKG